MMKLTQEEKDLVERLQENTRFMDIINKVNKTFAEEQQAFEEIGARMNFVPNRAEDIFFYNLKHSPIYKK
ncbi:MAG: hypothetical protein ISS25_01735 [Nanoarchaeota archaeon]|nr:hypothetical protein [DPANN group archaeon]MBL7116530.1 hypothetical protein [Nanoarchaeota archaeon]